MIPSDDDLRLRELLAEVFAATGATDAIVRELHALIDSEAEWFCWEGPETSA